MIGGCSGVGKSSLVRRLKTGIEIVHTGSIARSMAGQPIEKISERILAEIKKREEVILDTHYASVNNLTGAYFFHQGLTDSDLMGLRQIPEKKFILIDSPLNKILYQRRTDSRRRIIDANHISEDYRLNRLYFGIYLNITGADGYVIKNIDFNKALVQLIQVVNGGEDD